MTDTPVMTTAASVDATDTPVIETGASVARTCGPVVKTDARVVTHAPTDADAGNAVESNGSAL
ncbi:MAG TPA: hypothetical protein VK762_04895 [Polyangiaceae bacterium]|nr:hypothetical protein [Polyangiaceae bacterium]